MSQVVKDEFLEFGESQSRNVQKKQEAAPLISGPVNVDGIDIQIDFQSETKEIQLM